MAAGPEFNSLTSRRGRCDRDEKGGAGLNRGPRAGSLEAEAVSKRLYFKPM